MPKLTTRTICYICTGVGTGPNYKKSFILDKSHNWFACMAPITVTYTAQVGLIRLIPQGTVDNNLGPDRLAGPKALDPNYFRQLTL